MGVLAHRPIQELDVGPMVLHFLHEQNLVDVVARQAVWCRDHDALEASGRGCIPQPVQAGAAQRGAAVAIIPKDMPQRLVPALSLNIGAQALELLLSGVCLGLALGRDPGVDGYGWHGGSPWA